MDAGHGTHAICWDSSGTSRPARLAFCGARRVGEGARGARHALVRARRAAESYKVPAGHATHCVVPVSLA